MFSHSNGESQTMKRPSSSSSSSCFWENFLRTDVFSGNRYCVFNSVCCFKVWPFALKWSCFDRRWISQMEILRLNILVQEFSVNSETCWINVLTEASFVINNPCHCSHRWRSDSYRVLFNAACIEFMSDEQQERVVWFENGYILDKRSFFYKRPIFWLKRLWVIFKNAPSWTQKKTMSSANSQRSVQCQWPEPSVHPAEL